MRNKIFYIFLSIILINFKTFSQEVFLSVTKEGIPENQIPSNATVITKEDIEKTNAKNVGEILDKISLYEFGHYGEIGSAKTIRLRNSTSNQVLILLNGIPLSGIGKGAFNLALLPVDSVEKIEILPGSASALFGANAVAGVVNIITKIPKENGTLVKSGLSYGGFNTYLVNGEVNHFGEKFSANFVATNQHSDGWRENSKYDNLSGFFNFFIPILYGNLKISGLTNISKTGVPGPATVSSEQWDGEIERKASTPFAQQKDNFNFVSVAYEDKFLTSKFSYDTQQMIYDNLQDPNVWNQTKTESNLNNLSFLNTITLPYKFFVSLNYEYSQLDQKYQLTPADNFKKDISNFGIALQNSLKYKNFNFIPTLRWDSNSLFGNKFSPQVIFVCSFKETKFTTALGTSWRTPTFLDLYWPDQIWTRGNPKLQPEESYSIDLGVERNVGSFGFKFNPFYRYIKKQIRWYPEDPSDTLSAWIPSNVDEAVAQGVESKFIFSIGKTFINDLSVLVSDNRVKKKGEEEKGWQKQAYSPLVSAVYNSTLYLPYEFIIVNVLKYNDTQYSADGEQGRKLKSFIMWDLKIEKILFKYLKLYISVNDLLSQKGVNRVGFSGEYPQYGRTYELGINVNFKI